MKEIMKDIGIEIIVKETFNSLYKLGYFLVDLNSICNFSEKINSQRIEDAKKSKKYSFGITSRYLNKNSLHSIKLVEFSQGSFFVSIIAPIIVGIILLIITKYINQGQNQNKMEIKTDNLTINNIININFNDNLPLSGNFENIMNELEKQKIIDQYSIIYDQDGKKILFHNIDRLKEQLGNKNW
jgi:hypothetical protein